MAICARERAGELRRSLLERLYDEGPELANRMGTGNAAATALEGVASVESYLELILPKTEHGLKERILPLFEGRLVIFAIHRLHWVRDMDRVIVLDRGRVVADGAPDEMRRGDTGYLALARDILGDAAPVEGGTTR